ncbi:type II secretion system major pseudopilin GspG [Pseudoduganella sp. R-43]|uniref:type II secretion system major pseudopilin GspG n=1 Tax=unclassified Pseudoduganella TaxID=2637179 RepID=UPI003CF80432
MNQRARGFTLLELLVVIVIVGMLAAFVGPKYFSQIGKSKVQIAKVQIEAFDKALQQYRIDTGHYPPAAAGLAALYVQPPNEPMWHGAYVKKGIPLDPWGSPYQYKIPGVDGRDFELMSFGSDGKQGGEGENADIPNY